jgi:hypothetical protein
LPRPINSSNASNFYLKEINEDPPVFHWKYKLENLSVI